jgi:hypothetical protein
MNAYKGVGSLKGGLNPIQIYVKTQIEIIIIIIIYCNWVVTWWQWLFYMYTKHEIGYY